EYGVPFYPPVPSYQLDRGRFENELVRRIVASGVELLEGSLVEDVDIREDGHAVRLSQEGTPLETRARWFVDSTGRAGFLKRKPGLELDTGHDVNAAWFRLGGGLDIEEWAADDAEWMGRMSQPGLRRFSTNHLCGEGYWVWLIPLASGPISIGVVADPRF